MDEGQIIGITITIVAVCALLAGFVWLFATGTRPKWPEGEATSTAGLDGLVCRVVWGEGLGLLPFADKALFTLRAVQAAAATKRAWGVRMHWDTWGLETFGVHVLPDDVFTETHPMGLPRALHSQAYLISATQRLGDAPPLIVMRASLVGHAGETGQPIIHELLHDKRYHDRRHEDPDVWGSGDTVESLAAAYFLQYTR